MTDYRRLMRRVADGDVVIFNGDIGVELERLGVEVQDGFACALATEKHPDLVRRVHENYIEAGAEIINGNTSVAGREFLRSGGLDHKSDELNRRSIELATEARESAGSGPVWIAGAISTDGEWKHVNAGTVRAGFARQADVIAEAGADLLLLEVLGCEAATAAVAIEESARTGLPVWVALSCVAEESPGEGAPCCRLNANLDDFRNGTPTFADSAADFAQLGGDVYFAFHAQVDVMREALRLLREAVDVPVGVYPHCGGSASDGQTNGTVSPSDFLEEAKMWVRGGAQIIGGCCGIGLDHIKLLRDGLADSRSMAER